MAAWEAEVEADLAPRDRWGCFGAESEAPEMVHVEAGNLKGDPSTPLRYSCSWPAPTQGMMKLS